MDETGSNPPEPLPPSDDFYVEDDLPTDDQPPPHRDDDLDAARIRQIAKLRRSAVRSRGYLLVGGIVCAVLGMQLIWNSISRFRMGNNSTASFFLLAAVVLFVLAVKAFLRAQQLRREAKASAISDPTTPPDLSQLSDGSQTWENLKDIR